MNSKKSEWPWVLCPIQRSIVPSHRAQWPSSVWPQRANLALCVNIHCVCARWENSPYTPWKWLPRVPVNICGCHGCHQSGWFLLNTREWSHAGDRGAELPLGHIELKSYTCQVEVSRLGRIGNNECVLFSYLVSPPSGNWHCFQIQFTNNRAN